MKASRAQVERALASAGADTRLFLLYGPDEAGSRALAARLAAAMGADSERIDFSGADLKEDPARLSDEAASISLFGGARWIMVDQAGDEIVDAVSALLDSPAAGNPVVVVAGALRATSALVKVALAAPTALVFASYPPDAGEASRLVKELGRGLGLVIRGDVARRIAEDAGGNRAVIEQEIVKFALYLDVSLQAPQGLDHDVLDAVGASADEGDLSRLVESVMTGDAATLEVEIGRLRAQGQEGITLIRALLRRLALLARLRAEVEQGNSVAAVMASSGKSLFWKEKPSISKEIGRWRSDLIARAVGRLIEAERDVMRPGGPGIVAAEASMFAICRQAARLR